MKIVANSTRKESSIFLGVESFIDIFHQNASPKRSSRIPPATVAAPSTDGPVPDTGIFGVGIGDGVAVGPPVGVGPIDLRHASVTLEKLKLLSRTRHENARDPD